MLIPSIVSAILPALAPAGDCPQAARLREAKPPYAVAHQVPPALGTPEASSDRRQAEREGAPERRAHRSVRIEVAFGDFSYLGRRKVFDRDKYASVDEVARILGLSPTRIYQYIDEGRLPHLYFDRRILIYLPLWDGERIDEPGTWPHEYFNWDGVDKAPRYSFTRRMGRDGKTRDAKEAGR
jgi:hypothetical protein